MKNKNKFIEEYDTIVQIFLITLMINIMRRFANHWMMLVRLWKEPMLTLMIEELSGKTVND